MISLQRSKILFMIFFLLLYQHIISTKSVYISKNINFTTMSVCLHLMISTLVKMSTLGDDKCLHLRKINVYIRRQSDFTLSDNVSMKTIHFYMMKISVYTLYLHL